MVWDYRQILRGESGYAFGSVVYGFNFKYARDNKLKHLHQKPIQGMLLPSNRIDVVKEYLKDGKTSYRYLRYFVPFKKKNDGSLESLSFSRSVEIDSRLYASTLDEAIEGYNRLLYDCIRFHEEQINKLREELI